jgi:hypothetical protein
MSVPAGSPWPYLREAARAFCPPFEIAAEHPGKLTVELRDPAETEPLRLRYRSDRGLVLRTYYLTIEAELPGEGPAEAGSLALRRGKLRWKRPKPRDGGRWSDGFTSPPVQSALKRLQVERLSLAWEPQRSRWRLRLETLSGSVTVTFFPALMTPNPFKRDEAEALAALLYALRRAPARTPA